MAREQRAPPAARGFFRTVSRPTLALLALVYILVAHLTGLVVFQSGFLLSRVAIPTLSPSPAAPPIAPTHGKAIVVLIDALRTDFISPHLPSPASPDHHGVLTLPAELTDKHPSHSLIFNTYSDPPTSTMQRLKGLTTGSLPTFVDIGSNFASTAVDEDSIVSQLTSAGKNVVFMGDDTWLSLFPDSFAHAHPFDSFNVEDLHTVDNGVIEHIFPYLDPSNASQWDLLIGHFLGVDHVGHRVGPYRDLMREKLTQMDEVLRQIVDLVDEDTLLVVLGDHGMDSKGNHGGDSELEVAAGLWLYSKGAPIASTRIDPAVSAHWPNYTFPGSSEPIRHLNQIDLVPTLSLLLGVPIPFNNLGSVIPECFKDTATLERATRHNAEQIMRFVQEYDDRAVIGDLTSLWKRATKAAEAVAAASPGSQLASELQADSIVANREFALLALEQLRALWAQFSVPHIALGIIILVLSFTTLLTLYLGVRGKGPMWDQYTRLSFDTAFYRSLIGGALVAVGTGVYFGSFLLAIKSFAVTVVVYSEVLLSLPLLHRIDDAELSSWTLERAIGPIVLVLHAVSFASNSFIMWEDRMVVYLFNTIVFVSLIRALNAPTASMRLKIIITSLSIMVIARLIGAITVCREEQQPYCRVTFYSGSTATVGVSALITIVLVALHLPRAVGMTLNISRSLAGPAWRILGVTFRGTLLLGAMYWLLEWAESWSVLEAKAIPLLHLTRNWIARLAFVVNGVILPYQWLTNGLCIEVQRQDQTGDDSAVTVYGFANSYGSTYILFLLIPFAAVHLVSQPMGQIALAGFLLIVLAYLELIDTEHDAFLLQRQFASSSNPGAFDGSGSTNSIVRPTFTSVVPLVLLGYIGFFATGHQAVLTSIQWKVAFVGFPTVTYPFAPVLVLLNTWGPFILSAIAIPLLTLWNVSPIPQGVVPLLVLSMQATLAALLYHTATTIASALFAAHLRRHLMVWKVFAPRFMMSGVTLLVVDLSSIVAIAIGVRVTAWKVRRTFKCDTF